MTNSDYDRAERISAIIEIAMMTFIALCLALAIVWVNSTP